MSKSLLDQVITDDNRLIGIILTRITFKTQLFKARQIIFQFKNNRDYLPVSEGSAADDLVTPSSYVFCRRKGLGVGGFKHPLF